MYPLRQYIYSDTYFCAVWQHASHLSSVETSTLNDILSTPKSQRICCLPRQEHNCLHQVNQTPDIQMSGSLSDLTPDLLVAKVEMWHMDKCHHHILKKIEHWSFFKKFHKCNDFIHSWLITWPSTKKRIFVENLIMSNPDTAFLDFITVITYDAENISRILHLSKFCTAPTGPERAGWPYLYNLVTSSPQSHWPWRFSKSVSLKHW